MIYRCTCGAEYELSEVSVWQRDKDSIECEFCGKKIIHWNGASVWYAKLLNKPSRENTTKHEE